MSQLLNHQVVRCTCCFAILKEPLFCQSIACHMDYGVDYKVRCASITCDKCEYCNHCSDCIHELQQKIKRLARRRPDEINYEYDSLVRQLQEMYGITY